MKDRLLRRAIAAHSLAGVALLCAQAGTAQTRTDAPAQGGDSQEGLGLQEIVVTAQRRAEGVQEVPISIQAFSGAQLQELGIKSSVDLAQFTPNVDMALPSGVGNQPIITIRGIGLNDYDTNNSGPNGVYADEVYLSNPSSQTMQTFDLARIEVLKGPQGTLYGRNSSGGAINFISADPTDTPTAKLHADYSSYNTVNLEGALSGPIADGLTGRLAFVENYSDGYVHNTFLDANNGTQNWAARGILQYKNSDGLKVTFNLHGGQVNNPFGGYQVLGDFVPGTQFNATPTECSVQQVYANQCVDLFGYKHVGGFYDEASESQNHTQIG
jgi:iron complex outermembrane recepter protein